MLNYPRVCVAILAKDKEDILPDWLASLEAWDYPKEKIALFIRTNNCTDNTARVISDWLAPLLNRYYSVSIDHSDVDEPVHQYDVHEWNEMRFEVLGRIREESIKYAKGIGAQFYFVADVDNFLYPSTLRRLVSYNMPVIAPFLRYAPAEGEESHYFYSNYHLVATENGYYEEDPRYYQVWKQEIRGNILCDVVHCTYLVRRDVFDHCVYRDGSGRYEYVIFSDHLRKNNIPQYLENSYVSGYLTLTENVEAIKQAMGYKTSGKN